MRRFVTGFIIIDVMPILWFLVLYTFIIPNEPGPFPIMAAAFAALSILLLQQKNMKNSILMMILIRLCQNGAEVTIQITVLKHIS